MYYIFFVIIYFCIFCNKTHAIDYYTDNFNQVDNSSWSYYCNYSYSNPSYRTECSANESSNFYGNGYILLSSTTPNFPVLVSKKKIFPETGDFSVKIKFRFPNVENRGVGLGIGFTGPFNKLFSQFGIWNDSSSFQNFKFYYNDFSSVLCKNFNNVNDTSERITFDNIQLKNSFWHYFVINKIGNYYYVYLDREQNENIPIYSVEIKNNCIPKIIWFGNFVSDNGGSWTTFSLDDLLVSSELLTINGLTPTPTETPIPTATETPIPTETPVPTETPIPTATLIPMATATPTPIEKRKKIFILPGLGASWNSDAIVFGNNVDDSQWKMTPFVNNYDGLIELFKNNGLAENIDYFVWNYDWRKPLATIESKFNDFVNSKNLTDDDEIYLIGHSLGGLVARLWAQDYKNTQTKEIFTLGSPHLGSLDSYSVWNGGKVLENKGISSVAFKILLGLQNKSFIFTDLNKIRSYAPIIKDLLPVFDYTLKNNRLLTWQSLESKNDNLYNKNQSINDIASKVNFIVGVGYSTPSLIKLDKRTVYDQALGLWPDGRISSFKSSIGDGTVLKNSANGGLSSFTEFNNDHGSIVNGSLALIAQKLELENRNISYSYVDNFSDSLVVFIGSPATGKLVCNDKVFEEKEGFIIAKNQGFNKCSLMLSPTGNGTVHLVFGNTKNSDWNYLEKEVIDKKDEKYQINFSTGKLEYGVLDRNSLVGMIKNDLLKLNLKKTVVSLERNDFSAVSAYVFYYRDKNNERVISQRILDNLYILASISGSNKKSLNYKFVDDYLYLIDKLVVLKSKRKPLSTNSAKSKLSVDSLNKDLKEMLKNKIYPNYQLVSVLVAGYSKEILLD